MPRKKVPKLNIIFLEIPKEQMQKRINLPKKETSIEKKYKNFRIARYIKDVNIKKESNESISNIKLAFNFDQNDIYMKNQKIAYDKSNNGSFHQSIVKDDNSDSQKCNDNNNHLFDYTFSPFIDDGLNDFETDLQDSLIKYL